MQTFITSNILKFDCSRKAYCCKNWDLYFDKQTIEKINNVPKNTFPQLNSNPDYYKIVHEKNLLYYARIKLINNKCIFLGEDSSCMVFNQFGKKNGNPLCRIFPFMKLKLSDRFSIITFWSCHSETERLFQNDFHLKTEILPNNNQFNEWPNIDFSMYKHVPFSKKTNLTWDAFYFLQDYIINQTRELSVWQILFMLCHLNKIFISSNDPLIDKTKIENHIRTALTSQNTFSNSSKRILFFLKRKINLYHNDNFINKMERLLEIDENNFFSEAPDLFLKELSLWDTALKNYFQLRFFYNPNNFITSMQFYWHIVLFYLNFIKIFVFPLWKTNKSLSKTDFINTISVLERHFMHDPHIFEFWGRENNKELAFNETSLFQLMV